MARGMMTWGSSGLHNVAMTPQIREATTDDWSDIWPIVREVVLAGDTFAYSPEMTDDGAGAVDGRYARADDCRCRQRRGARDSEHVRKPCRARCARGECKPHGGVDRTGPRRGTGARRGRADLGPRGRVQSNAVQRGRRDKRGGGRALPLRRVLDRRNGPRRVRPPRSRCRRAAHHVPETSMRRLLLPQRTVPPTSCWPLLHAAPLEASPASLEASQVPRAHENSDVRPRLAFRPQADRQRRCIAGPPAPSSTAIRSTLPSAWGARDAWDD